MPALEKLKAHTAREAHIAASPLHRLAIAVSGKYGEVGACKNERRDVFLKTIHARPLEAEVQGDDKLVKHDALVAVALRCPNGLFTKVHLCATKIINEAKIDAESDAGEHEFGHNACLTTKLLLNSDQVLLEMQVGECAASCHAPTELRICSASAANNGQRNQRYSYKIFHLYFSFAIISSMSQRLCSPFTISLRATLPAASSDSPMMAT